jgi:hypothetical protein
LFTNPEHYTETYISVANQRDEYERTNYPDGVWIVRLESPDAPKTKVLVNGKDRTRPIPRWSLGRFRSSGAARKFIASRTTPEEVAAKFYNKICDCLSWEYMIDYKQCKGVIFERCRHCGNPTKEIFREPLNKLVTDDFDLDEFLGL